MTTILVGAVLAYMLWRIHEQMERRRDEAIVQRLLTLYSQALTAVQSDPKQLLVWYPLVRGSRALYPQAFAQLDRAFGGSFPFSKDQLKAAHDRWSTDWLVWERAHDAEFATRIAAVQDEVDRAGTASPLLRTRLAALEQQKLERYQQRYEEYVKTAKALAAFAE